MPATTFAAIKMHDREVIQAFRLIGKDAGLQIQSITGQLIDQMPSTPFPLEEGELDENSRAILDSEATLFFRLSVSFPASNGQVSVSVKREGGHDTVTVNFNTNDFSPTVAAKILAAAHKHLRAYDRTESIDKFLGDELAEFYRKREAALLKLEQITQNLINQNTEYRQRVDEEAAALREKLRAEHDSRLDAMTTDIQSKEKKLDERTEVLDQRTKDLDDRSSKHARRQIHKDLKSEIAQRNKAFVLSQKTIAKRLPVHVLFWVIILILGAVALRSFLTSPQPENTIAFWLSTARSIGSVAALVATIVFYLRWNDRWFHSHADEEFRLKRLDLDIDRASWVVEMALEWKDEEGKQIPMSLLDRLTTNLFRIEERTESVRHPTEDLASALLGASSALKLQIPGVGEASLNRKGIREFQKSAEDASS
jgi:hypothetical protein